LGAGIRKAWSLRQLKYNNKARILKPTIPSEMYFTDVKVNIMVFWTKRL